MPSTSKPTKRRKAAGKRPKGRKGHAASRRRKTLRARRRHRTTAAAQQGARGIAFRLSQEHVQLIAAQVRALNSGGDGKANSPSDVLRSLLVTHLLIDNPHVDGILFAGDYRVRKKKSAWIVTCGKEEKGAYKAVEGPKGWFVADRDGKAVAMATGASAKATTKIMTAEQATKAARDIAFLRAEWLAQEGSGSVQPEDTHRKGETKAFRLPIDERTALQRLATQNGTTLSEVLRSFLTTALSQGHGRLMEVTLGTGRSIHPCPEGGWSVRNRSFVGTKSTLRKAFEVFEGIEWTASKSAA
jgi:hypothetical protein